MPESTNDVVSISNLSRRFGSKAALNDVTFGVPKGTVFGLVGENGAGKSTLIKHVLGLWRAQSGSVRVFDLDPVANPTSVLGRVGYMSEQPDLPGWMRVDELLRYTAAFYRAWDPAYAEELRERFDLDPRARIKTLSKGQRAKVGLIAAQAHRPDLLILDEPSSGLDPIVRRDILETVIRTVADEGRTVLFSSHLLDEIERVSDHLAMLHQGKLILCGPLEDIKRRHSRVLLRFKFEQSDPPRVNGWSCLSGSNKDWVFVGDSSYGLTSAFVQGLGASVVDEGPASLDEIFIAHSGKSCTLQPLH
jgi:ABC-2 type transport system ATP-binding protein